MEGFHSPAVNPRVLLVQLPNLVCASAACCGSAWAVVGGGGLQGWKGNPGLGQAGQEAESLQRQPVPPAGPRGAEGLAWLSCSTQEPGGWEGSCEPREVVLGIKFTHVLKGTEQRGRPHEKSTQCLPPSALSAAWRHSRKQHNPRPDSETTGCGSLSPRTGPMTCPSRSWLAPCGAQPPKGSLALLTSDTGQSCLGP